MLAADLPIVDRAKALITQMGPNSVVATDLTPAPSSISVKTKSLFSAKHLLVVGGIGFIGLLAYLLLAPPKKKPAPSAPISGWFSRRRRR